MEELSRLPQCRDRWVALDNDPRRPGGGTHQLRSGAVVVDVDPELDELCARLRADEQTALTIVYCKSR